MQMNSSAPQLKVVQREKTMVILTSSRSPTTLISGDRDTRRSSLSLSRPKTVPFEKRAFCAKTHQGPTPSLSSPPIGSAAQGSVPAPEAAAANNLRSVLPHPRFAIENTRDVVIMGQIYNH